MVARRGDLVKLVMVVGSIVGILSTGCYEIILIPVNRWKGQLPKDVVNKRVERFYGSNNCKGFKTHAWDAVGIGLYYKGEMFQ